MSAAATIIRTYQEKIADVRPAGIQMTLPIHLDNPVPIHVPQPRRHPNPANRTAYPPLQADQPCGRCNASPLMRRQYYYRGVTIRTCLNCGWDGYRRAAEGMPDQCRQSANPFAPPCEELQPCPKHG